MHRHRDEKLRELLQRLMLMGGLSEHMLDLAMRTLVERQPAHAAEVYAKENEVNELQMEIDDRAIKLTVLQQPVAMDARFLFMAVRISSDLERIADLAVNVCQTAEKLIKEPPLKPLVDLPIMSEIARRMVQRGLDALANRDCALAEQVLEEEHKVDALRSQIFRELLTYMMSEPTSIPRALGLILISRHLERVGDHATNIAEDVVYLVKGRDIRHHHGLSEEPAAETSGTAPKAADAPPSGV
jgi:phosphate transport system protein